MMRYGHKEEERPQRRETRRKLMTFARQSYARSAGVC